MQTALIVAAALFGAVMGSFASVVAHRVPRRVSIGGRSRCPQCDHVVSARENIPVVSFLLQRGRCRHCAGAIPWRYPVLETVTAILFALVAWKFGATPTAVVYAAFLWTLVVLSAIDLEHGLLLNRIVFPTFIAGWVSLAVLSIVGGESHRLVDAALGALIFGGFMFVVAFVYPAGMGGGDFKLAFVLGTFLGYLGAPGIVIVGMFLSFLVGSVVGVATVVAKGGGRKTAIPFGPSLAAGTALAIFAGQPLVDAYVGRL